MQQPTTFDTDLRPFDPETGRALAIAAFLGLDQMLAIHPHDEPLMAGQVGAIIRLIREAVEPSWRAERRLD